MGKSALATVERCQIVVPKPFADVVDEVNLATIGTNIEGVCKDLDKAIKRGVEEIADHRLADAIVSDAAAVIKTATAIRKEFTSPARDYCSNFIEAERELVAPVVERKATLEKIVMEKAIADRAKAERIRREAEAKKQAAIDAARKKQERNEKISLAKGGNGVVVPVEPEPVAAPVVLTEMRQTVRMKSIVDKDKLEGAVEAGARKIPGCHIWCEWRVKVIDAKAVPDEYRRFIRG
jgi:hypothetical protein